MAEEILLDVQHLTHVFPLGRRMSVRAVDDLSFQIRRGEIFGLVGESGSGKSTAARCVMNLCRPQSGRILYKGIDTCDRAAFRANRRMLQTTRQLIFQDTSSSLNQRMRVWDIIAEPLRLQRVVPPRGSLRAEAAFQMHYVGLDESFLDKYPPELSGGQRQRVAIARALAMVEFLCDRVGVMYRGRLVETAPTAELFSNPLHPYTQALLSAIPIPDPRRERSRQLVTFHGEDLPPGGALREAGPDHFVLRSLGSGED